MVLGFALVWVIIWIWSPFALELVVMSVRRDGTTQGIVTAGLPGIRSVGLCNVCNTVGPLLTACSADVCVRCMYTPGEQQVRRNGLDAKKHGKARRKKAKLLD